HLAFVEFALQQSGTAPLTAADYEELSTRWSNAGAPDWLFTDGPHGPRAKVAATQFATMLRRAQMPEPLVAKLVALRPNVPAFLERCADEVLAADPTIVGFTIVYSQTISSVALARTIKARRPDVHIVFGGACCDGPMGPALLRAYREVDFVVRGEGELVLTRLCTALAAQDLEAARALPGLCSRMGPLSLDLVVNAPSPSQRPQLEELPLPSYDEYFARLQRSPLAATILPRIPYQSARGCWWGMKSHCKFCGLNGTDMEFRSRTPLRVHDDLVALAERHSTIDFTIVDNIMDMDYLATLMPALAAGPLDLGLFCEAKANLTHAQVRVLARAGVRTIQPGIESLSTPVLKLMGKGVNALQNIRLLRWCAEAGMHVIWNLLYGFPGESASEYGRMADMARGLVHLAPPNLGPLMLARFSPYFESPARHGLRRGAPLPFYEAFYDAPSEVLADLASVCRHEYVDGRDPKTYVAALREQIAHWQQHADRNRRALTFRRGPGFLVITDTRTTMTGARYQLDAVESAAYLACSDIATVAAIEGSIERATGAAVSAERLSELLATFVAERLVVEDGGKYLALAIPTAVDWGKDAVEEQGQDGVVESRCASA
ncbi:MAG: RiPP maturation radical SAM C-methyltransferase, partial [Planctomycetota bacterium]